MNKRNLKMNKKEIIENLFQVSEKTYYNHKNAGRPIIDLIETYFTDSDLIEFLETNQISRFKNIKNINIENEKLKQISFSLFDSVFIDLVQISRMKIDRAMNLLLKENYNLDYNIMKLPFFILLTIIDKFKTYPSAVCEKKIKQFMYEIIILNKTYLDYDRLFLLLGTHNKMLCHIINCLKNDDLRLEYFQSSNIHKISNLYQMYNNFKELVYTDKDIRTDKELLTKINKIYNNF
jgi:hypothetical protein